MKRLICILTLLVASLTPTLGQTVAELEAEIKRAEKEIAKNERLLKEVSANKKNNQTEI